MTNKDSNHDKKLPLYLDYAATTPVDPRVVQKMNECLSFDGIFGNAHSNHVFGRQAQPVIEEARAQIADLLHAVPRNVIFTSGATEANNLTIKGVANFYQNRGRHIITVNTEHKSVLDVCRHLETQGFEVTYLPVNQQGLVEMDVLKAACREDTILVSIMHVNNETGVVQDIESMGNMIREKGIFFHVDAAQSVGKIPIDLQRLPVDLLSFSGHKIYGPKGIGALYISDNPRVRLMPQMHGGGQERKLRAGTLPTHQIVGLGEACRILKDGLQQEAAIIKGFRDRFWRGIADLPGIAVNGDLNACLPNILNVRFSGVEQAKARGNLSGNLPGKLLAQLEDDLAVSSSAACNTLYLEPSYVLRAMGLADKEADSSIRFSFGRFTTDAQIEEAVHCIRTKYLEYSN